MSVYHNFRSRFLFKSCNFLISFFIVLIWFYFWINFNGFKRQSKNFFYSLNYSQKFKTKATFLFFWLILYKYRVSSEIGYIQITKISLSFLPKFRIFCAFFHKFHFCEKIRKFSFVGNCRTARTGNCRTARTENCRTARTNRTAVRTNRKLNGLSGLLETVGLPGLLENVRLPRLTGNYLFRNWKRKTDSWKDLWRITNTRELENN